MIEEKLDMLAELCRKFSVCRLDVFGSAAVGDFGKSSDIDFLVEFDKNADKVRFDNYFGLLEELKKLFTRPIDLVEPGGLRNPYLIKRVEETRRPIYVAS